MDFRKKKGFTLVETVLAIGIVGVLIVVFVAMFYPARKVVSAALTVQEADRVVNALTDELNVVRKTELMSGSSKVSTPLKYVSSFDKAFYWMLSTSTPATTILIYSYRGDLDKPVREDGTFEPFESSDYVPGRNSVLVTTACLARNESRYGDMKNAVGPILAVRMTQLVVDRKGGASRYILADSPGKISNPYDQSVVIKKPEEYVYDLKSKKEPSWGAEVVYHAEFFQVNSRDPRSLKSTSWAQLKKPFFTRNLVFRR